MNANSEANRKTDRIVCATLRSKCEELHEAAHPLRIALNTIRIIEGKE